MCGNNNRHFLRGQGGAGPFLIIVLSNPNIFQHCILVWMKVCGPDPGTRDTGQLKLERVGRAAAGAGAATGDRSSVLHPLSPAARPSSRPRPAPPGPAAPPLSGARQSEAGRGGEQSSTAAVCRDNTAVSRVRTGARTQWQIAVWPGHLPAPAPAQHRLVSSIAALVSCHQLIPARALGRGWVLLVAAWHLSGARRQPHQDTVHHSPVLARPQPRLQVGWLGHSFLLGGLSQRLRPTYLTWMALELELVSLTSHHTPSLTFVCFRFQLSQCWAACEEGSPPKWT